MSSASQRPKAGNVDGSEHDVHAARTAVAPLPTTVLEELRRAKKVARASSFTNEAPTVPGKHGMRMLRPLAPDVDDVPPPAASESLAGAMLAALAEPKSVPTLPAPPPPEPEPSLAAMLEPELEVEPEPASLVAMTTVNLPQETRVPLVRAQLAVALAIVASTALVLAIIAIAEGFIRP